MSRHYTQLELEERHHHNVLHQEIRTQQDYEKRLIIAAGIDLELINKFALKREVSLSKLYDEIQ